MESYIVQEGDNIITIAKMFGVRIIDIINANNLSDATYLEPGTELVIPRMSTAPFISYIIKKGDTLYDIAGRYNISVDDLAAINGLEKDEYIYEDQKIMVPNTNIKIYLTKQGDTLKTVANKLNLTQDELLEYNEQIYLLPEQILVYRNINGQSTS